MKKIIMIICLCLIAVFIRNSIYSLLPIYLNTIIVNLIGSLIYLYVVNSLEIKLEIKKMITIAFLGTLTTYSGVFNDLYLLFNHNNMVMLILYFIIIFLLIPLVLLLILNNFVNKGAE